METATGKHRSGIAIAALPSPGTEASGSRRAQRQEVRVSRRLGDLGHRVTDLVEHSPKLVPLPLNLSETRDDRIQRGRSLPWTPSTSSGRNACSLLLVRLPHIPGANVDAQLVGDLLTSQGFGAGLAAVPLQSIEAAFLFSRREAAAWAWGLLAGRGTTPSLPPGLLACGLLSWRLPGFLLGGHGWCGEESW